MKNDDENIKRPAFGARFLKDPNNVYQHNVWDNIQWDEEQEEEARKKVEKQAEQKIPEESKQKLQKDTKHRWDKFYNIHQNRFFKDRHWLFTEFPELARSGEKAEIPARVYPSGDGFVAEDKSGSMDNAPSLTEATKSADSVVSSVLSEAQTKDKCYQKTFFEIGCGVGNTVLPILKYNIDPNLFVYCCDFSDSAVEILKCHEDYNPRRCQAFVCDITADDWKTPFPDTSLDISTLIFTLSAVHPQKMQHVVDKLFNYLKPGGQVLFRDYGRYDMAQLRFKDGQMMENNFYVRKDGTFVYFFTQDEVRDLFCRSGFEAELLYTDRRLQVNRSRQLKMYRVWVQAKFRKPLMR